MRKSSALTLLIVLILTFINVGTPLIFARDFYFRDDATIQFLPALLEIGRLLLNSELPWLTHRIWNGGNFLLETQVGATNPVLWILGMFFNFMKSLEDMAAILVFFHMFFAHLASYLISRHLGMKKTIATCISFVANTSIYLVFFHASAWWSGLIGFCWFQWTLLGMLKLREGRSGFILFIGSGYLLFSSGHSHSIISFLALFFLFSLYSSEQRRSWKFFAFSLGSLFLVAAPTYLPSLSSLSYLDRYVGFKNNGIGTVRWDDLINSYSPTFLPLTKFPSGLMKDHFLPIFYFSWASFILFFSTSWSQLKRIEEVGPSLRYFTLSFVAILVLSMGPERLFAFRWPVRFIPYLYFIIVVIFGISLQFQNWKDDKKSLVKISLISIWMLYLSLTRVETWNFTNVAPHLVVFIICLFFILLLSRRPKLLPSYLLFTHIAVYMGTVALWKDHAMHGWGVSKSLDRSLSFQKESQKFSFSNIQNPLQFELAIGNLKQSFQRPQDPVMGSQILNDLTRNSINGYSPLGHRSLNRVFCFSNFGETCVGETHRGPFCSNLESPCTSDWSFLTKRESQSQVPLIDLMKVAKVSIQNSEFNKSISQELMYLKFQKTNILEDETVVFQREPSDLKGTLAWHSPQIQVDLKLANSRSETWRVQFLSEQKTPALMIFSRLWWPGYQSHSSETKTETLPIEDVLVGVAIQPQSQPIELKIEYQPRGMTLALMMMFFGLLMSTFYLNFSKEYPQSKLAA